MSSELDALMEAITRVSGLSPREDWSGQLMRTLEGAAVMRGTTVEALIQDPTGWSFLMPFFLNAVTVRETFFLRHSGHFEYAVDDIGARLNAAPNSPICVWSAGCATGEEPYSLAIAIHARLGAEALARVRILASDISADAISKARIGVYSAWAFRDAPSWVSNGYFEQRAGEGARIVEAVRGAVTFEVTNILQQAATLANGSVDVVFFRNVAIYLNPSPREEVYREFYRILKPEGLLIVAPADPRPKRHFVDGGHESTSIYRARVTSDEPPILQEKTPQTWPVRAPSSEFPVIATPPPTPPKIPQSTDTAPAFGMTEAEALRIADMGDQATVSAMVTSLLAQPSTAPTGYMIRAHLSLDSGQHAAAIEDLRRVLYLRPEHRLARYWYVEALQATGQHAIAMAQGRQLELDLAQCPDCTILEDGETSAAQLLEAVRFVKEGLT